jgi:hypothetical protein
LGFLEQLDQWIVFTYHGTVVQMSINR